MSLSQNLLAGLASSTWTALINLAVVPLYLKYLGMEAYGLIGFFATMQAILVLLDMGLAPTINREVARHSAIGNLSESGRLLHTLAVVYWSMAIGAALLIFALAPTIAEHWLQSKNLPPQTVQHAVMLMGFVSVCRWPVGLYQGALMGAQHIVVASAVSTAMATLTSLGAVAVLAFVSPTIEAFFMWQACLSLLNALTMRFAAWRIIGRLKKLCFDVDALKQIWRFSAGMSGVTILGIVLMQLDKVLLSKILNLEDFGSYALAGVIANGLLVLLTPVFNVLYPRLSVLVVSKNTEELAKVYRTGTRLLSTVIFSTAMMAGVFAEDVLYVWTGNREISITVAPILFLLLIGTALNGIMIFPYALQLAFGIVLLPLKICLILIICTIPATIFLSLKYGVIGGAFSWFLMNGIYLFIGSWLTHRNILKEIGFKWFSQDVGTPLVFSLSTMKMAGDIIHNLELSPIVNIFTAAGTGLLYILLFTSIPLVWQRHRECYYNLITIIKNMKS